MAMKKAAAAQNKVQVEVRGLVREAVTLFLMGDSPLIVHAWSQKAKLELLQKHMQQITVREAKDPWDHFLRSMYRLDEDSSYGFPVVGIKEAMASAAVDLEGIFKTQIYRNISVTGRRGYELAAFANLKTPHELAEVFSPNAAVIREDMVRLSGMQRTPDLRYRAEFWPWAIRFTVLFLPDFISSQSIVNLLHHAGARIGLGEWRQERGGTHGTFHVANEGESKQIERWLKAGQKEPEPIDIGAWLRSIAPERKEPTIQAAVRKANKRGNGKERHA